MIDVDNYKRCNPIHIVSIANMPILKEVVQAKNEQDAIINILNRYDIICDSIQKTNKANANCIVNDNYYLINYYMGGY